MNHVTDHAWGDAPPQAPRKVGNLKRAGIALGFAIVFFSIFHVVCGRVAVSMLEPTGDGWQDLGFVVALLAYGALAVVALVPMAVFTVGLGVDVVTRRWPRGRAAVVHGAVGFIMGIAVAGVAVAGDLSGWGAALVAFAVPPALAAFATHLMVPTALRHRGIAWAAWVMASLVILASLLFFVSILGG